MIYLPDYGELFFFRIAPGVYRVVCDGLFTDAPHCMVGEALEVLVGEDYFYNLTDNL